MQKKAKIDLKGSYRAHGSLFPDDRKGYGYGQVSPTGFNASRQSTSTYPYIPEDPYSDDELSLPIDEDELDKFVRMTNMGSVPTDSLSYAAVDPFYFVGGNTKLSDCIWKTDKVLNEIVAFNKSIVAIPGLYKGRGPSMTGYGPAFPYPGGGGTNYKRTGTLQGYAHRPPQAQAYDNPEIYAYTLTDILDDDELALEKSKKEAENIKIKNQEEIQEEGFYGF